MDLQHWRSKKFKCVGTNKSQTLYVSTPLLSLLSPLKNFPWPMLGDWVWSTLSFVLSPLCSRISPNKSLAWNSLLASNQFLLFREPKDQVGDSRKNFPPPCCNYISLFFSVSSSLLTPCLWSSTTHSPPVFPTILLNYISLVEHGSAMVLGM